MKRILLRVAFRLGLDLIILTLRARALAYGIASDLVGLEIRVKDRLWGRGNW